MLLSSIIFFLSLLHTFQTESEENIISKLESGNFRETNDIIKNLADTDFKKYLYALSLMHQQDYINSLSAAETIESTTTKFQEFKDYIKYLVDVSTAMKLHQTKHFKIFANDSETIMFELAQETLEEAYKKYGELFGYYPSTRVAVEIYTYKDDFSFLSTLGDEAIKRSGAIGICKFNRIMILSPRNLPLGYRWRDALAHEYIHLLLNHITKFNSPLWLQEGTARYFETYWRKEDLEIESLSQTDKNLLLNAIKNNSFIPLQKMKYSLVYLDNQQQVQLAFAQLSLAIENLNKKFGTEKFKNFLYSLSQKEVDNALLEIFDTTVDDIEESIFETVKNSNWKEEKGIFTEKKYLDEFDEFKEFIGPSIEGYIRLGDKFRDRNNLKIAINEYKKALNIEEYNPLVALRIAKIKIRLKEYKEVEDILKKVLEKNNNYAPLYFWIAENFFLQGHYEDAIKYFNEYNCLNPFNPDVYRRLIQIYSDLLMKDKVKENVEKLLILLPNDVEANLFLRGIMNTK